MGTKPWQCLGALCLGGLLLCGCQSEEKRPVFGPSSTGINKTTPGGQQPVAFPGTTGSGTTTGLNTGGLNPTGGT